MQLSYLPFVQLKDARELSAVRAFVLAGLLLVTGSAEANPPRSQSQAAAAVAHLVDTYFASLPDYRAGDLISRSDIEGVIRQIEKAGGKVKIADTLIDRGLPENSILVRELSSPAGKKFMRKIGHQPGAYARLDRLSSLPRGQKLVHELVHTRGGEQMLDYLGTTRGGKNLGRTMADARNGVDLNKPTDRIYTQSELVAALMGGGHVKKR
jgi:hypothetical protein